MRSQRTLIGTLILTICGVGVFSMVWSRAHTLYPTPDTESTFLRSYTPEPIIKQYRCSGESFGYGRQSGAEPGTKFVSHTRDFDWHFAMRSEKWMPLMNALRDDVSAQLQANGAQILRKSGDPHDGFRFEYKLGKSFGTLTILPLTIDSGVRRARPLPAGIVDVSARIEQRETWFAKEPGTIVVKFDDSPRR